MKASDMLNAQQKFTETSKSNNFYNYSGLILSNPKAQYLQAMATNFECLFGKLAIDDTDSLGACLAMERNRHRCVGYERCVSI